MTYSIQQARLANWYALRAAALGMGGVASDWRHWRNRCIEQARAFRTR